MNKRSVIALLELVLVGIVVSIILPSCTQHSAESIHDQYAIPLPSGMAVDLVNVVSYEMNGESYLLLWQSDNSIIRIYSLSSKEYTDSITTRQWGISDIAGIDVDVEHNAIHVLPQGGTQLLTIGFDATLIDRKIIVAPHDSNSTEYEVYSPFFVSGDRFYCTIGAALEPSQFVRKPVFARLDFQTGTWQPIAWQPKKLQENSDYGFYYFNFSIIDREKQVYCLQSPVEDTIRVFKETQLEQVVPVTEFHSKFEPKPKDMKGGAEVVFETTHSHFTGLHYYSSDNTIAALRVDRQPMRDTSGLFNSLYLRPFTLGLVNQDGGEISFYRFAKQFYLFNPCPFLIKNSIFGRRKFTTNRGSDTLFIGRIK